MMILSILRIVWLDYMIKYDLNYTFTIVWLDYMITHRI